MDQGAGRRDGEGEELQNETEYITMNSTFMYDNNAPIKNLHKLKKVQKKVRRREEERKGGNMRIEIEQIMLSASMAMSK